MQTARELYEKLVTLDLNGAYMLSIYLDMRPHTTGERPAAREALTFLKDRFREIEKTLLPRDPALNDFQQDREAVQNYLDNHAESWLQGVAIFACRPRGIFEVLEAGVAFENQVAFEPYPDLFQLARLLVEQETVVTALVDTNTARLFVTRRGFLEEVAAPDDDPFGYGKRKAGGINQKRYHRRADNKRKEFARETATALEEVVAQEGASSIILAGDAIAIPLLHQELPAQLEPLVHEEILRLDIRTPRHVVHSEIQPLLEEIEAEKSHSRANTLIEELRANGLGVSGWQETRDALEHGQVDVLLLEDDAPISEQERNELVLLAGRTGAEVEVVADHDPLQQLGGVGALLRYRAHWV